MHWTSICSVVGEFRKPGAAPTLQPTWATALGPNPVQSTEEFLCRTKPLKCQEHLLNFLHLQRPPPGNLGESLCKQGNSRFPAYGDLPQDLQRHISVNKERSCGSQCRGTGWEESLESCASMPGPRCFCASMLRPVPGTVLTCVSYGGMGPTSRHG